MKKNDIFVFVILILTFLIWSNSFIAIGLLREKVTAMELVTLRFAPVGVISLGIILVFYRRQALSLLKNHPLRILVMGLLCVESYNFFLNYGMTYVKASASSLIICLNPLVTLILAVKFLKEPYNKRRWAGTILAFLGLVVVVLFGRVGVQESTVIPLEKVHFAVMVAMASLSWAINTIISKPLVGKYSPVAVNYVLLSVASLPLLATIDRQLLRKVAAFEWPDWGALVFLSLVCTVLAFTLWFVALKHWKAANVALFVYLNPPMTAIFSWLLLGQRITGYFFLGGLVMLSGIVLATWRKNS